MERVDLLQLHTPITVDRRTPTVSVADLLGAIVPACSRLIEQGKMRFVGNHGAGDTAALLEVIDAGVLHTAQSASTSSTPAPPTKCPPASRLRTSAGSSWRLSGERMGAIVIRVLAAGALSGTDARHPIAVPAVIRSLRDPTTRRMCSNARMLGALVEEGHVESLVEASLRFALATDAGSTVLLGYSSLEHLEYAAACVAKGPLPPTTLERLPVLWGRLVGV